MYGYDIVYFDDNYSIRLSMERWFLYIVKNEMKSNTDLIELFKKKKKKEIKIKNSYDALQK